MIASHLMHTLATAGSAPAEFPALITESAQEPGWLITAVFATLGIAILITLVRLLKGPSLADRVVALDLIAYFIIAAIGVYAIRFDTPELIMIAIVMALILFLGTAGFALYLERRARP